MISKLVKEGYLKRIRNGLFSLKENEITVVKASSVRALDVEYVYTIMRPNIILYLTDNFDYAESNIVFTEKAFIDLFYAITRNQIQKY